MQIVSASPHIRNNLTIQKVMGLVIISLLPAVFAAGYYYGARAIHLIVFCALFSCAIEATIQFVMKKPITISDLSAVVTGILIALNLPVTFPFWMAFIGCFVAIAIVKQLFGGLGQNFANPAITARIVLMMSFTAQMSNFISPKFWGSKNWFFSASIPNYADSLTGATPLVLSNDVFEPGYADMFFGNIRGTIGEISAFALLIGGVFLIVTGIIKPIIPLAYIGSFALCMFIAGEDAMYQILAGGLILGAFFMATDYATTPLTNRGKLIFGLGCGVLTFIIRHFSSYPEGVSYSILLMNILTPYIDMICKSKPFGVVKQK